MTWMFLLHEWITFAFSSALFFNVLDFPENGIRISRSASYDTKSVSHRLPYTPIILLHDFHMVWGTDGPIHNISVFSYIGSNRDKEHLSLEALRFNSSNLDVGDACDSAY